MIKSISLEDYLSDKQIDILKSEGSRYENLYNRIFVPQNKNKVS